MGEQEMAQSREQAQFDRSQATQATQSKIQNDGMLAKAKAKTMSKPKVKP
jgi:dephospho-CoA kinase